MLFYDSSQTLVCVVCDLKGQLSSYSWQKGLDGSSSVRPQLLQASSQGSQSHKVTAAFFAMCATHIVSQASMQLPAWPQSCQHSLQTIMSIVPTIIVCAGAAAVVPTHPVLNTMLPCCALLQSMFVSEWTDGKGWDQGALKPYGPMQLMPSAQVRNSTPACTYQGAFEN
jgi:hypothetical protein